MSVRTRLYEAHLAGRIVRIHHAIDPGHVDGFVAAVGSKCFVLEIFDETIRLNGFSCLRYSDAKDCESPAPYHAFQSRVLELRGQSRSKAPSLNLSSLPGAMRSAKEQGLCVSLHVRHDDSEDEEPDEDLSNVCYIGTILSFGLGTIAMRCIDPDAIWDNEPLTLDVGEIYRLDFGGGYEEALLLVSGARDEPTSAS